MAGMNKSLGLIEHETRYSQIHLLNILEKINKHIPGIDDINLRLNEFRTFGIGVFPQPGYAGFGGGSGNTTLYFQAPVYGGPAGLDELTSEIVSRLRKLGVKFG